MTLDEARKRIEREKDALNAQGVSALYLFGSVARGEAMPDSDVDVLIDVEPGRRFNILHLAGVYNRLRSTLGTEVDLVTLRSMDGQFRQKVLADAVRVY